MSAIITIPAEMIVAIEAAVIVTIVEPAVMVAIKPAIVIAIVVAIRAAIVVAVTHAAYVVPISRYPVAAVIVPIHPRISRTGARRNVGFISDAYCDSHLGCIRRVGSKHQTSG